MQIQDHRNTASKSQSSPSTSNHDKNIPFSIHNWNEHLTPSPYVPHPHPTTSDTSGNKSVPRKAEKDTAPAGTEKQSRPVPEQSSGSTSKDPSKGPTVFTTILFPTPLSLQEEVLVYASTPEYRSNNRKQSQNVGRTPTSSTLPQPPTPLSAVPPTPSFPVPPAKRQKMMVSGNDIPVFEGKIIAAMAAPLYLDPVSSLQDTQKVLQTLQDPLFQNKPPAPKTRKKTVAELAADEALAAEEQCFMLIMDERLVPSTNFVAGNTAGVDGESGAASFEPRFERFKALEEIKLNHHEKARREQEAKTMQQALVKSKQQEQQDREARQIHEAKLRTAPQEHMRLLQMNQLKRERDLQQQQQMAVASNQHSHPPTSNDMMNSAQQLAVSQAHHSSPVVRNLTPHNNNNNNSSPLVGSTMVGHPGQSLPMSMSTSSQGAGSPPRPGSALQHAHSAVTSGMAHQRNQQQPSSRNGTPQIPNGTPRLPQANTPGTRHVTPTPRMSHASPANSAIVSSTPVPSHSMMATPHMNGQQLTPQQQQALMQQRHQQAALAGQHAMQNSPPMNQANLQARAAHQAHQLNQARNLSSQDLYRRQLQSLTQQQHQMGASQNPDAQLAANMALHRQQQAAAQAAVSSAQHHPSQQASQQVSQNQKMIQQAFISRVASNIFPRLMAAAQATHGPHLPGEIQQQIKVQAFNQARQVVATEQRKAMFGQQQAQAQAQAAQAAQLQMHQQQQQQHQSMMNGGMGMGGMGGMGLGGMNGM